MNILLEKNYELEPSLEEIKLWTEFTKQLLFSYLNNLSCEPAYKKAKAKLRKAKAPIFADEPGDFCAVLKDFFEKSISDGINTASGYYFGYIPGGGLLTGAFADFVAAFINRYSGLYLTAPSLVTMENQVIEFFCELFEFPKDSWGALTSGGSIANMTALMAARSTRARTQWDISTIYMTDQCHSSCLRALRALGLNPDLIRAIALDKSLRMDTEALESQILADISLGFKPWIIIASLGTTNAGSVDPIEKLAQIKKKYKLWLHIDAAYGGFFKLIKSLAKYFKGVSQSDSLVLDPHKSLFLPYGSGAFLVRDASLLKHAFACDEPYLEDVKSDKNYSPADYSLELSRNSRAPRIYLSLKTFGIDSFRKALEEKIALTHYAYTYLRKIPLLEFACEPELSVIAFRVRNNQYHTQRLLDIILDRGKVHLSSTRINNKIYVRICILSFRSHKEHVKICLEEITYALEHL